MEIFPIFAISSVSSRPVIFTPAVGNITNMTVQNSYNTVRQIRQSGAHSSYSNLEFWVLISCLVALIGVGVWGVGKMFE